MTQELEDHDHNFAKLIEKNKLNDFAVKWGKIPHFWVVFTLWAFEGQNTRNVWENRIKFAV